MSSALHKSKMSLQEWVDACRGAIHDPLTTARIEPRLSDEYLNELKKSTENADVNVAEAALCGPGLKVARENEKVALSKDPGPGLREDSQEFIDAMVDSPGLGLSTIFQMARATSGWNPLLPTDGDNAKNYEKYVGNVSANPLLQVSSDYTEESYEHKDFDILVDKIVNLYEGIESEEKEKIKSSLVSLTKSALSHTDQKQTQELCVQSTIDFPDSEEVDGYIYHSKVTIEYRSGKGMDIVESHVVVSKVHVQLKYAMWLPVNIKTLCNEFLSSLDEWVNANTSPDGDSSNEFACEKKMRLGSA